MIAIVAALALAAETPEAPGFAVSGHRIAPVGGVPGVALTEALVLGGDGGTAVTTVAARFDAGPVQGQIALPFASYATRTGRDTDLGNLALGGWYPLDPIDDIHHAVGLSLSTNLGGRAWTWANRPEEVWPGWGVDALWQGRTTHLGPLTLLGRGGFGVHGSPGYDPFPSVWPRVQVAAGADYGLTEWGGVTAEASLAYWDISPFEIAGLGHATVMNGLQIRGGAVFPLATWLGWTPTGLPGGMRELTLRLEVVTAVK